VAGKHLRRPTDFFGTEPLVQRFQDSGAAAFKPQTDFTTARFRHEPDELLIDGPGIENASPLDIEALADDQPADFLCIGRRQIEGVVNKIELAESGLRQRLQLPNRLLRRPLPESPPFNDGRGAVAAIHGTAAPCLKRHPEIPVIGRQKMMNAGNRQTAEVPDKRPFALQSAAPQVKAGQSCRILSLRQPRQ